MCLSCNKNKLLIAGIDLEAGDYGFCKLQYRCLNAKIETQGDIFGRDCKCDERRCHRCDKTAAGDVCLKCKGEKYLLNGTCVDTCPPSMTSVGNKVIGRRCSLPFTCDSNIAKGEGVSGKCICSTTAHKNHNDCKVCDFEAGAFGQTCTKCGNAQFLNPETNQCEPDCSHVEEQPVVQYKINRNGAQCRKPFTCKNGVDEAGKACKCHNKVANNCEECEWFVPTEEGALPNRCTVCAEGKLLDQGVCVRRCSKGFVEINGACIEAP